MNFLQVLLFSLKAKITPLWTKFKMWTNLSFIKAKVTTGIRNFFTKTLSLKPRHKKDYYGVGRWLVSKKLCFAIVMVAGVASLYYLIFVNPIIALSSGEDGIRTYSYNSIPLRFAEGTVRIKAKSGYVAFMGEVNDGACNGQGTLFDKDGNHVYVGNFTQSKFNGQGKTFFKNGQVQYEGTFLDNIFEGEGILYRNNGSREYEGSFSVGMKEGEGTLYDAADNPVYNGIFSRDQLVYQSLLGKKTTEVASMYTGNRDIYSDGKTFAVYMKDIDAIYTGKADPDKVDDSVVVEGVYVLSDTFNLDGQDLKTITDLCEAFGTAYYEGNSKAILAEAVAVNCLSEKKDTALGRASMTKSQVFSDYYEVEKFDNDYTVYLYSFAKEGILYTFFCSAKNGNFEMYLLESE